MTGCQPKLEPGSSRRFRGRVEPLGRRERWVGGSWRAVTTYFWCRVKIRKNPRSEEVVKPARALRFPFLFLNREMHFPPCARGEAPPALEPSHSVQRIRKDPGARGQKAGFPKGERGRSRTPRGGLAGRTPAAGSCVCLAPFHLKRADLLKPDA